MEILTNRKLWLATILAGILVIGIWAWQQSHHPQVAIRNVLLSIDTCRADRLGCYGYWRNTTPRIDAMADRGILFENTISPAPMTLPSHSSMLTGTNPPYHDIHDNLNSQLSPSNVTLAEILSKHGFTTAAIVSATVLEAQFGLNQGFDEYIDEMDGATAHANERSGAATSQLAMQWLDKHQDEPFFLFLHYFDPHDAYLPPPPFSNLFSDNLYAGEIAYTDHCIGQVIDKLETLGLLDTTLLIITGDHGEMRGDHGESDHSFFIYQGAVKVPLIIVPPGRRTPKRIDQLAGLIDIVPTICGLLGFKPPPEVHGEDLSAHIYHGKRQADITNRKIFCESFTPTKYNANPLIGVVSDRWKYIHTTRPELYDLQNDPLESKNLARYKPRLVSDFSEWIEWTIDTQSRHESDSNVDLDPETLAKLKQLGYVGGDVSIDYSLTSNDKTDPKDLIAFHMSGKKIAALVGAKKHAEARIVCHAMLAERPDYWTGHFSLAEMALSEHDYPAALPHLRRSLELRPNHSPTHRRLGVVLRQLKQTDEAIDQFHKALQIRPSYTLARFNLANLLALQGNYQEATQHFRRALEEIPNQPMEQYKFALLLLEDDKPHEAIKELRKTVQLSPDAPEAINTLAWVLATHHDPALRDPTHALELATRAAKITGHADPSILDTLAAAYAANGHYEKAVSTAQHTLSLLSGSASSPLAKRLKTRLDLYQNSMPYYEQQPND